jgi:hypothetical protein
MRPSPTSSIASTSPIPERHQHNRAFGNSLLYGQLGTSIQPAVERRSAVHGYCLWLPRVPTAHGDRRSRSRSSRCVSQVRPGDPRSQPRRPEIKSWRHASKCFPARQGEDSRPEVDPSFLKHTPKTETMTAPGPGDTPVPRPCSTLAPPLPMSPPCSERKIEQAVTVTHSFAFQYADPRSTPETP